jgi:opacity protein-like surface antigen
MHRRTNAVALALALLSSLTAAVAAQTPPEWSFTVTPYFWLAGLDGKVGVRRVAAHVDLSFGDIIDALQFAVMGSANARYKSYVFGVDGMYIATGDVATTAFRGDTGSLTLNQKETMIQPTVGYTFLSASSGFDVLVGLRVWHLSADLDVDRTRRPSNRRSGSKTWVDGTAGVQAHWNPQRILRITLGGDIGAGGSRWTWQAYGGAGVDVATWCTLGLYYRGLSVDYDRDDFLYDTNTQGFLIGATFRFPATARP